MADASAGHHPPAGRRDPTDAIFRIASQTKAPISVGIMMLQEEGKLLITDRVGKYLPEFTRTTVGVPDNEGGYNTDILGAVIEKVSGQPLDVFMRERILDPLGMNDTHFYLPTADRDRLATVYSATNGGIEGVRILTPKTVELMTTDHLRGIPFRADWATFQNPHQYPAGIDWVRLVLR